METDGPAVVELMADVAAAALYTDCSLIPDGRRNYVRLLFTDSAIRGMHREWEHDTRDAVAALRMEAAADPGDPELARLVGELSVQTGSGRLKRYRLRAGGCYVMRKAQSPNERRGHIVPAKGGIGKPTGHLAAGRG